MAQLGLGPYRTGDIANATDGTSSQLVPVRDALITKGMIFSSRYGYAAITVPLFDEFMRRGNRPVNDEMVLKMRFIPASTGKGMSAIPCNQDLVQCAD